MPRVAKDRAEDVGGGLLDILLGRGKRGEDGLGGVGAEQLAAADDDAADGHATVFVEGLGLSVGEEGPFLGFGEVFRLCLGFYGERSANFLVRGGK